MNPTIEFWRQEWNHFRKDWNEMRNSILEITSLDTATSNDNKNPIHSKYFEYNINYHSGDTIKELYLGKQLKILKPDLPGEAYLVKPPNSNRKYHTFISVPRNITITKIEKIVRNSSVEKKNIPYDDKGNPILPNEQGIVVFHDGTSTNIVEGNHKYISAEAWRNAIEKTDKTVNDISYLMHSHPKVYGDSAYDRIHIPSLGDRDIRNKYSDGIGLICCKKEKTSSVNGINHTTSSNPNDYKDSLTIYTPNRIIP